MNASLLTAPRSVVPPRSEYVPVRNPLQWVAAAAGLVILAWIVYLILINPNLDFGTVLSNITNEMILEGLLRTFQLTLIAMLIGTALGVLIACARISKNRLMNSLADLYIWFFRGVPLLVQILIWGNFALLFPNLGIGIPFTDVMFVEVPTNSVITVFVASLLALSLHEAAYMAEVVRGGLQGVDQGQEEAAKALGMSGWRIMTRIILPQALRMIIPPTGNQLISLLKASALVSVIAGGELMTVANDIGAISYKTLELLAVATFWYLVIVTVLSAVQKVLEKRMSRGVRR